MKNVDSLFALSGPNTQHRRIDDLVDFDAGDGLGLSEGFDDDLCFDLEEDNYSEQIDRDVSNLISELSVFGRS